MTTPEEKINAIQNRDRTARVAGYMYVGAKGEDLICCLTCKRIDHFYDAIRRTSQEDAEKEFAGDGWSKNHDDLYVCGDCQEKAPEEKMEIPKPCAVCGFSTGSVSMFYHNLCGWSIGCYQNPRYLGWMTEPPLREVACVFSPTSDRPIKMHLDGFKAMAEALKAWNDLITRCSGMKCYE